MQIPKLIAFDVDGTLIGWDGQVSTATRDVLAQIRQMGIPIVLATGRPMAVSAHTLDVVRGADWMACGNGSVLFEVASGSLLRDQCLPYEIVEPIVLGLRAKVPGIGFALELSSRIIEEPGFAERVPEPHVSPPVADALATLLEAPEPVRRIIPFHSEYDSRLDEMADIVGEFIDERCQVQFGGLPIVDISPSGNHKAAALQVLVDHLDMTAADVIAFGDGRNDVEMLQWAGTGVAMGNGHVELQAIADVVTESVDTGGVSAFLKPLLTAAE